MRSEASSPHLRISLCTCILCVPIFMFCMHSRQYKVCWYINWPHPWLLLITLAFCASCPGFNSRPMTIKESVDDFTWPNIPFEENE